MTKKFLLQVIYPGELKRDVHTKTLMQMFIVTSVVISEK